MGMNGIMIRVFLGLFLAPLSASLRFRLASTFAFSVVVCSFVRSYPHHENGATFPNVLTKKKLKALFLSEDQKGVGKR